MANKNQLIFDIDGDESGLKRSLKNAGNELGSFSDKVGGSFGGISSGLKTVSLGFGAVAGAGITALAGLALASNNYVRELNQISNNTRLTVEDIQRLGHAFYDTGLSMEKFGDFNKDTLDKLGDAFRNGGGVADDIKEYGLDVQQYAKFLNQADGGMKAVIHTFYEMKKAGRSVGEITNVLETLASDSSHLITTFEKFNSEAEANSYIQSQNISLTNEAAAEYKKFDAELNKLTGSMKLALAEGLTPFVAGLNTLIGALSESPKQMGFFNELNDSIRESTGSLQDMLDIWRQLRQAGNLNYMGAGFTTGTLDNGSKDPVQESRDTVKRKANDLAADVNNAIAEAKAPKGGFVNKEKEAADAEKASKKAASEAQRAADKLAREEATAAQKRVQAALSLNSILSGLADNNATLQINQFDRQQNEIERKIKESAKVLNYTEAQTADALKQHYADRARAFKDMTDSMLRESDPKQLAANLRELGDRITPEQRDDYIRRKDLADVNNSERNVFDSKQNNVLAEDQQYNSNEQLSLLQAEYDAKLFTEEQYLTRKAELEQRFGRETIALQSQIATTQMNTIAAMAGDVGSILSGAFGENNKLAAAAFAVQKGIAVASSIVAIQESIAKAMSLGFPANIPVIGAAISQGASIVSTLKGTSIKGQAHDGIDSIPNTGTWNLEKGERVVGKTLNADLSKYLKESSSNENGNIEVNAPMIINGAGDISPAKFTEMCKEHADTILQVVRQSQQRNS
ncbi:hypothetical protein ACX1IQ_21065 [Yersinia enterocolitica]